MGFMDKAKNAAEKLMGEGKQAVGKHTDNPDLEAEGEAEESLYHFTWNPAGVASSIAPIAGALCAAGRAPGACASRPQRPSRPAVSLLTV